MNELFRADYRDIRVYGGDSKGFEIDLSDNTNQWGAPPAAERALRAAAGIAHGNPAPDRATKQQPAATHDEAGGQQCQRRAHGRRAEGAGANLGRRDEET